MAALSFPLKHITLSPKGKHLKKYISPTVHILVTQQENAHTSSKSNSMKFNPEDSVPGFRVEPRPLPTTVQVPEFGSTRNMGDYNDGTTVPGRACSSVHVANTSTSREMASSHSHIPQFGATGLTNAAEVTNQNQPPDIPTSSHKNPPEVKDTISREVSNIFLSSHVARAVAFLCGQNHGRKFRRIHHSGPLVPPGGNIEDMLKEHERHIQEAVRKARLRQGAGSQVNME
jgi:hypothetical protein